VLVLLVGRISEVHRWDGLRLHDVHTKFNYDRFRHSSNIKGINSTIWEAIVLVLLMRGVYVVCYWGGLRLHNIYTKYNDRFRHSSNIRGISSTIWEDIVLVLLMRGIYKVRRWDGFMWHDIGTKFHEDWYRRSSNIKVLLQKFERLWCWYYWWKRFIIYAVDMGSGGTI
jgi:hypothetical protein